MLVHHGGGRVRSDCQIGQSQALYLGFLVFVAAKFTLALQGISIDFLHHCQRSLANFASLPALELFFVGRIDRLTKIHQVGVRAFRLWLQLFIQLLKWLSPTVGVGLGNLAAMLEICLKLLGLHLLLLYILCDFLYNLAKKAADFFEPTFLCGHGLT